MRDEEEECIGGHLGSFVREVDVTWKGDEVGKFGR